jgi:hypothetical protein
MKGAHPLFTENSWILAQPRSGVQSTCIMHIQGLGSNTSGAAARVKPIWYVSWYQERNGVRDKFWWKIPIGFSVVVYAPSRKRD